MTLVFPHNNEYIVHIAVHISGQSAGPSALPKGAGVQCHRLWLSTGAHSIHQMLHRVSRLPKGEKSPFQSALLQSNAILSVGMERRRSVPRHMPV